MCGFLLLGGQEDEFDLGHHLLLVSLMLVDLLSVRGFDQVGAFERGDRDDIYVIPLGFGEVVVLEVSKDLCARIESVNVQFRIGIKNSFRLALNLENDDRDEMTETYQDILGEQSPEFRQAVEFLVQTRVQRTS